MDYQLWLGDCLEEMNKIEDHSVDLILADLPYGTTASKWDERVSLLLLWQQYKKVKKNKTAILLFGSQPFTSMLVISNPTWFKYEWIWIKERGTGFQVAKHRPMIAHESILVFGKSSVTYNPQMSVLNRVKLEKYATSKSGASPLDYINEGYRRADERYPENILCFSRDREFLHPNQKPVALMEYLIKTYSNEGDLILDNTMGSGSTGEAALRCKRKFIGIEKDEDYFQIAKKRLESLVELPTGKIEKIKNEDVEIDIGLW